MEVKPRFSARAKKLSVSPAKMRPIANNIRGKNCQLALGILEAMPQKSALLLKKLLRVAVANAVYIDNNLQEESLYIKTIMIDAGETRYRIWPRSRGKADRQIRRSSRALIVLDEVRK